MTNFDFLLSSPDFAAFWGGGEIKIVHPAKPGKTGNPEKIFDAAILWINKKRR